MAEIDDRLEQLQARLDNLVKYQEYFYREISQLTHEINQLKEWREKNNAAAGGQAKPAEQTGHTLPAHENIFAPPVSPALGQPAAASQPAQNVPSVTQPSHSTASHSSPILAATPGAAAKPGEKSDLEKFVGENLISKIGIVVLVIGVAIGGKYAIDNGWISPLIRILFGYAIGVGLLGFAVRLKRNYHNFSAVLLSGAMTILYFITFFATAIFALIPQTAAFAIMLVVTVATVVSAIRYDRQIIAHLGLVGAYLIPFLIGGDSGNYTFLFVYIAIINAGILIVSIKKYWKEIFYTSFIFTWLIFSAWSITKYNAAEHFGLTFFFLTLYFLIFYVTFIIHRLVYHENLSYHNIGLTLANAAVFYCGGCILLDSRLDYHGYLGLFTIINAGIHFVFAVIVSRIKNVHRDVLYLTTALVLTFVTIAVPVQFDGNKVTLIWIAEAAILFVIGRRNQIALYEYYSYPVMVLAGVSLVNDWSRLLDNRSISDLGTNPYPFLNVYFLTTMMAAAATAIIFYFNSREEYEPAVNKELQKFIGYGAAAAGIFLLYNAFRGEIANYFYYQLALTAVHDAGEIMTGALRTDDDLIGKSIVWQLNYTMFFLSLLALVNIRYWRNGVLAAINLLLNYLTLAVFLLPGLFFFALLQESYLSQEYAEIFPRGVFNIQIRYVSYMFVALLLFTCDRMIKEGLLKKYDTRAQLFILFDLSFHISILIIASFELVKWMQILSYAGAYKFGLSLLWGLYALSLIVIGIARNKKHLRIMAIAMFAVTLIKLFLYDTSELDTISKTLLFVSVGIILLIASFLYSKYRHLIFPPDEDQEPADAAEKTL